MDRAKLKEVNVFGKQIKSLRIKLGKSQEDLAYDLNLSSTGLSNLENGESYPSFETLLKLRQQYRFNVNACLDEIRREVDAFEDNDK